MKNGTDSKLKFKQLQRRLGLSLWQARGLLDTLWNFAANNCPHGDIGRFTNEEIAIGIDWREEPDILVGSLVDSRWLDVVEPPTRLAIHDWPEHCEHEVHRVLAKRAECFSDGTLPSLARINREDRQEIIAKLTLKYGKDSVQVWKAPNCAKLRQMAQDGAEIRPASTMPLPIPLPLPLPQEHMRLASADADCANDTTCRGGETKVPESTPHKGGNGSKKKDRVPYTADFEEWFAAYPRRAAKAKASEAYHRKLPTIILMRSVGREEAKAWLLETTKRFAESPAGKSGQFTPYPATWLNAGRYDDDPSEWNRVRDADRPPPGPGQRWNGE